MPHAWVSTMNSTPVSHGLPVSGTRPAHASKHALPLKLFVVLALVGAIVPTIQMSREPEPWRASVTLGLDGRAGPKARETLDLALREIRTPQALGRAVDLLGLDRDPEFSGSASSALGVALEIVAGETSGPADARRRAIERLGEDIALEHEPGDPQATLLVRASEPEKAVRIAEAIATVYASGSELTGSISPAASEVARRQLQDAEAALAAFGQKVGADKLSTALVLASRISGLNNHIRSLSQVADAPDNALAKASLKDVMEGRMPASSGNADLDRLRQAFVNAKLMADSLSVSLGPKHPRLVAARSELESARQALSAELARVKKRLQKIAEGRGLNLKTLEAEKADLDRQLAATGIDLAAHAKLDDAVKAAREAYAASAELAAKDKETVLQASVPKPLDIPDALLPIWKILLGALAGTAIAAAFAAWRRLSGARGTDASPSGVRVFNEDLETPKPAKHVEPSFAPDWHPVAPPSAPRLRNRIAANAAFPTGAHSVPAGRDDVPPTDIGMQLRLDSIRARVRALDAANRPSKRALPCHVPNGLDRIAPEDGPVIEKLRQVAPHMFADPVEDAEIERLRLELAELRERVIRKAGAA